MIAGVPRWGESESSGLLNLQGWTPEDDGTWRATGSLGAAVLSRTREHPQDPLPQLALAAVGTTTPHQLWHRVAELVSDACGGASVHVEFADRMAVGTVDAGSTTDGRAEPWTLESGVTDDQRVTTTVVPAPSPELRGTVRTIIDAAAPLAELVTRRALLEFERRQGAFLAHFATWMHEAATDTGALPEKTVQAVMHLTNAQTGIVVQDARDWRLEPILAVGVDTEAAADIVELVAPAIRQVTHAGAPLMMPRPDEKGTGKPREVGARFGPTIIVPLAAGGRVRGAMCLLRTLSGGAGRPFEARDMTIADTAAAGIWDALELSDCLGKAGHAADRAIADLEASAVPMATVSPDGTILRANPAFVTLFAETDSSSLTGRLVSSLPFVVQGSTVQEILARSRDGLPWKGRLHLLRGNDLRRCEGIAIRPADTDAVELLLAIHDRTEEFASGIVRSEVDDELFGAILKHVDQVARITKQILDLPHGATAKEQAVGIGDLLRELIDIRSRVLHAQAALIHAELTSTPQFVKADPSALQQVFVNLLANAEEAVRESTDPRIEVQMVRVNGHVRIRVSDSGPGVAPDLRSRVFDPFFTTKDRDRALGLGLTVSKHVVSRLGGRIWVEDGELKGAAFTVELPAAADA